METAAAVEIRDIKIINQCLGRKEGWGGAKGCIMTRPQSGSTERTGLTVHPLSTLKETETAINGAEGVAQEDIVSLLCSRVSLFSSTMC